MQDFRKLFWIGVSTWLFMAAVLFLAVTLTGCSTANQWQPRRPEVVAPPVPVCVQWGSKLYDRATGKECPDLHRHHPRCSSAATVSGNCR